jgi:predicted transposase YbfD/YdcC
LKQFSTLAGEREPWRVAYSLAEVLLLLTCATIASCDDFDEIAGWGEHHLDFLRKFAPFHHGIPCERWPRTLRSRCCDRSPAMVNRVDPVLFGRCFEGWIKALWPERHDLIAIDGTTSRRTHAKRKGLKAPHTLGAYATNARLTLAQLSVPEKTNEITAIPELLDHLAKTGQLEGALVTIDTKVEIAAKIVAHKADFLLALKGNHPVLEKETGSYFDTAPAHELVTKTTVEKGHGRIETRIYTASQNARWIRAGKSYPGQPRFEHIETLVRVLNRTEYADRRTFDTRLHISSAPLDIERLADACVATGASRACIGCSIWSSRTICRAIVAAMAP